MLEMVVPSISMKACAFLLVSVTELGIQWEQSSPCKCEWKGLCSVQVRAEQFLEQCPCKGCYGLCLFGNQPDSWAAQWSIHPGSMEVKPTKRGHHSVINHMLCMQKFPGLIPSISRSCFARKLPVSFMYLQRHWGGSEQLQEAPGCGDGPSVSPVHVSWFLQAARTSRDVAVPAASTLSLPRVLDWLLSKCCPSADQNQNPDHSINGMLNVKAVLLYE